MDITQLLDICISDKLIDMVISGQKNKSEDKAVKVRIRPVILKNEIEYQVSEFVGRKVLHSNHSAADVKKKIIDYMTEDFKQAQINMTDAAATILSSKSKTLTCKYKKAGQLKVQRDLSHNRTKKYIIQEGKPVAFMIDLGVMGQDGKIIRTRYDKFRQINRFLEYIEDILPKLDKERELTIIDFGCGKSYLTFAMYYYLKELKGYNDNSGYKYIVIQTTSKGLYPDVTGTPVEDEAFYDMIEAAVDIIFNPSETRFMHLVRAHGAKAYNGLEMLLYQGVAAFELWNDIRVPDELCRELYELMKKEMGQN